MITSFIFNELTENTILSAMEDTLFTGTLIPCECFNATISPNAKTITDFVATVGAVGGVGSASLVMNILTFVYIIVKIIINIIRRRNQKSTVQNNTSLELPTHIGKLPTNV